MVRILDISGRIDEFDEFDTPAKLLANIEDIHSGEYKDQSGTLQPEAPYVQKLRDSVEPMFAPLGLEGVYMVTGIEGKFYNGYNDPDEVPWPLTVTPNMSAFDIMVGAAKSEANGYPDVNHVWFESLVIDDQAHTLQFSMGS